MDLLGTYDSDDERGADSTPDTPAPKGDFRKSLEEFRNKYKKPNDNPPLKHRNRFNSVPKTGHRSGSSDDMALLSYDRGDDQTSLRSRLYSDYQKSKHFEEKELGSGDLAVARETKQETVVYNPNKGESLVVAIELGSRNNSTGVVRATDESHCTSYDRSLETLKTKSERLAKQLHTEHTRKSEDMMYANYPVDHPLYKSHSTLANYTNNGSTFCLSETVGSVHSNPSGVTEKLYYNEVAFQDDLLRNDLKVVLENDGPVADKKRRRLTQDEVKSEDIFGPWIPFEEGELPVHPAVETPKEVEKKPKPKTKNQLGSSLPKYSPEQAAPLNEVLVSDGKQTTKFNDINVSTFHRKVEAARPTRSWVLPPKNAKHFDPETYKSHLPKQEVFTYLGHTMAVQKIEFFPKTGHYLLSASMDGFVKIWDVGGSRKCVRTYKGHAKGVRDVAFLENGAKFFSCSFDSNAILWDTEYGKIVGVYPTEKTPYCLTVYPKDENIFIVGGENKKACQFDARSGEVVLEYNEHLGCVNTVTFIDNNRRLLTTGDDKKLLVWDFNIPVVVKQISNPAMHTIPALINHPNDKFVLAQSMDNQIVVYESAGSRFKLFGRKRFRGHQNSGYAIRPCCSPDGRYVVSGDARGKLFIWDWKTCKNLQTLAGHKAVTMDCKWHPSYPSSLASCSWDGTIKLWE